MTGSVPPHGMREGRGRSALADERTGGQDTVRLPGPRRRWLTYLLLMPLIVLSTTFFGCLSLLNSLWDRRGSQQHGIARVWARSLLVIAGSPVRVLHEERLQADVAVYASNHLSYMDTPVLYARLPFQFRILAKQNLWKVPFIGWHLRRSGQVAVDQSSARASISSLGRGVAALKAGMPLVVFPEGGRSPEGDVQAFLSGAAYMAIRAQVPLVPLTLVGTYEVLPMHVYHLAPRPLLLVVGEPISTVGLGPRDADALTEQLRQEITQTYLRYSAEDARGREGLCRNDRVS